MSETKKCPDCDAEVGTNEEKCPKCGLEFEVIDETAIQNFERLERISKKRKPAPAPAPAPPKKPKSFWSSLTGKE